MDLPYRLELELAVGRAPATPKAAQVARKHSNYFVICTKPQGSRSMARFFANVRTYLLAAFQGYNSKYIIKQNRLRVKNARDVIINRS
jgi:ribose 5-phosphate isomerase RpiB